MGTAAFKAFRGPQADCPRGLDRSVVPDISDVSVMRGIPPRAKSNP